MLAGGSVQTQVPQAEALRFARLCGVSARGRTVLLRDERPPGLLRLGPSLGVPRSTEGDPAKKCTQKYVVLANSLVANETNRQPCPNKAFAGGQAVAGEVSLLFLFPFLRTTALKKSSRQSSLCLSALNSKSRLASSAKLQHLLLPIYFRLPPEPELLLCREVIALE